MFKVVSAFCLGLFVGQKYHSNLETYWDDFRHTQLYKELEEKFKKNE